MNDFAYGAILGLALGFIVGTLYMRLLITDVICHI